MVEELDLRATDDDTNDSSQIVGLAWWERVAAGIVGTAGGMAGSFAVFHTANQAGSAALLLLGSVFLLISVQGTAIRRANKDSVELDRRTAPKLVFRQAEKVLEENGTVGARQFIDGAVTSNPMIVDSPQLAAFENSVAEVERYEVDLMSALSRVSNWHAHRGGHYDDRGAIELVGKSHGDFAYVYVLYVSPSQPANYSAARMRVLKALDEVSDWIPTVIVTNMIIPGPLGLPLKGQDSLFPQRVEVVTWRGVDDDDGLGEAIAKVLTHPHSPEEPADEE